jgi:outer membrane protein OmpA-like peptidoglycan-associated protein
MKRALSELSFLVFAAAITAGGCATKGFVRGEIDAARDAMQARDAELASSIDEVRNSSTEAMARAEAAAGSAGEARDLALGRVGYELVDTYAVHFARNSEELTDESRATLDEAAIRIRSHGEYLVDIYGFTDRSGSSSYNLVLGQRRADAVLRYLAGQDLGSLARLAAVSFGEDRPAASDDQSRRVEVCLIMRTAPKEELSESSPQ